MCVDTKSFGPRQIAIHDDTFAHQLFRSFPMGEKHAREFASQVSIDLLKRRTDATTD